MERSIVSVRTSASIHKRHGRRSRPSTDLANTDDAPALPGSSVQHVRVTEAKRPRRTISPPLISSPSSTRELSSSPVKVQAATLGEGAGKRKTGRLNAAD